MFSTSVLECHKSLDQTMVKSLGVLSENRLSENAQNTPSKMCKRPSWPQAPGLFASDKENRPAQDPEAKVNKSAWWQQQCDADALKQQQAQQRLRAGAEEQLQRLRSARRSEGAGEDPSELRRRCRELELERDALSLRAQAALRLEAELEAEKAPRDRRWLFQMLPAPMHVFSDRLRRPSTPPFSPLPQEEARAAHLAQQLRGSEAAARRAGAGLGRGLCWA